MVIDDIFSKADLSPRVRMELSANESIKQAIMAGLGISFMSRNTLGLEREESELAVLDVQGFPLELQWYIVYPVGKQISAVARTFMDFVRAEANTLVSDHHALQKPASTPSLTRLAA